MNSFRPLHILLAHQPPDLPQLNVRHTDTQLPQINIPSTPSEIPHHPDNIERIDTLPPLSGAAHFLGEQMFRLEEREGGLSAFEGFKLRAEGDVHEFSGEPSWSAGVDRYAYCVIPYCAELDVRVDVCAVGLDRGGSCKANRQADRNGKQRRSVSTTRRDYTNEIKSSTAK